MPDAPKNYAARRTHHEVRHGCDARDDIEDGQRQGDASRHKLAGTYDASSRGQLPLLIISAAIGVVLVNFWRINLQANNNNVSYHSRKLRNWESRFRRQLKVAAAGRSSKKASKSVAMQVSGQSLEARGSNIHNVKDEDAIMVAGNIGVDNNNQEANYESDDMAVEMIPASSSPGEGSEEGKATMHNESKPASVGESPLPAAMASSYALVDESLTFSACLLIKDQNDLLPEWLAYHWTVLPLRRLIVAVDPLSFTDPTSILDLYTSIGMNVTVWKDVSYYWADGDEPHQKLDFTIADNTDFESVRGRHRHRQKQFYRQCLQELHDEGRGWTFVTDTDEYIAFNYYDELEGPPTLCRGNSTCEEDYLKSTRDGTNMRSKLAASTTVADIIQSHSDGQFHNPNKPCILLSRYLFVSKRSEVDESQMGVGEGFDASDFHTLQYHHRASLGSIQRGKCIVNVAYYYGREIGGVHRLLGDLCTGNGGYAHNSGNSLRVHHYIGSWESFRQPGFDNRGLNAFRKRNDFDEEEIVFDNKTGFSKGITWLARFVDLVGKDKALSLTQRARLHAEGEKRVLEEKASSNIDWSRINKSN